MWVSPLERKLNNSCSYPCFQTGPFLYQCLERLNLQVFNILGRQHAIE